MADAVCPLLPEGARPFCEALPPYWSSVLGAIILGILVYMAILRLLMARSRWKAVSKWRQPTSDARLPRQDDDVPALIIIPPSPKIADWLVAGSEILYAKTQRKKTEWRRQTRDDDEADLHAQEALVQAAYTRGLQYLPPRYANQLHLRIAREWIIAKQAPKDALALLDARIADLGQDILIDALFNPHALDELEIERPTNAPASTYFTKFFQPLMVAFHEDSFRNSAGVLPDGQVILLEHMKLVSMRRVKALDLQAGLAQCTATTLCNLLPQPLPSSFKPQEKLEIKQFNRKEAAHALVVISGQASLGLAEMYSIRIDEHLAKTKETYLGLTQDETAEANQM